MCVLGCFGDLKREAAERVGDSGAPQLTRAEPRIFLTLSSISVIVRKTLRSPWPGGGHSTHSANARITSEDMKTVLHKQVHQKHLKTRFFTFFRIRSENSSHQVIFKFSRSRLQIVRSCIIAGISVSVHWKKGCFYHWNSQKTLPDVTCKAGWSLPLSDTPPCGGASPTQSLNVDPQATSSAFLE